MKRETLSFSVCGRFIFLAQDLLVLPRAEDAVLEIIKLPDPKRLEGITDTRFRRIVRLHLPRPLGFEGKVQLHRVHCNAYPILGDTALTSSACRDPFYPDPEKAIILVQICPRKRDELSELVVYRRTLLEAVETSEMWSAADSDNVRDLPWEDWALQGNAVVWIYNGAGVMPLDSSCLDSAIYGQRLATMDGDKVIVRDFNPYVFMHTEYLLANGEDSEEEEKEEEEKEEPESESESEAEEGSVRLNKTTRLQLVDKTCHFQIPPDGKIYPGPKVVQKGRLAYVETIQRLAEGLPEHGWYNGVYMDGERIIYTFEDTVEGARYRGIGFHVFVVPQTSS